jgi:1-deoxy-D-xylulose-5-phosphate synthase
MVMQHLAWCSLLEKGLKFRPLTLPERIIDHDTQAEQCDEARLNAARIIMTVQTALGHNDVKQHDWHHVWFSCPALRTYGFG